MNIGNQINGTSLVTNYKKFLLNQLSEKLSEREVICYLEETINNICDRVRNKMVAPYSALQAMHDERDSEELVEMGVEDITWLCHKFIPDILASVREKVKQLH